MRKLLLFVALVALAGACGGDGAAGDLPAPVVADDEIRQMEADAAAFAVEHIEVWPDVDAYTEAFADEIVFADPTFGDFRVGREGITAMWQAWAEATDYETVVDDFFVSVEGVAYPQTWPGLTPPVPVPDVPLPLETHGLMIYAFEEGEVVRNDIWYPPDENALFELGCFALEDCPTLEDTVGRYVQAWSSRNADDIAVLYSDDAAFTDSMLGLEAAGGGDVAELADVRFGSGGDLTVDVLGLYAWTDGFRPPSDVSPDLGRLIGVAIHYRATVVEDGTKRIQEGLSTLELGERDEAGLEADPEGLIHHEEVFHRAESLLAGPVDTGTMTISFQDWSGVEGYRLLAGVSSAADDELVGGAFWTHVDSDPFSGEDEVHPVAFAVGNADARDWAADDYRWDDVARFEAGRYRIDVWANPGELAPYGSHIPAGSIERQCWIDDVEVRAGEVVTVTITDVPAVPGPCPRVSP